ncbi:MAG: glycosyltransferase family 9 protein [Alphaproteobacteria bacterium]|nr:glycosyltransferase family 9 protein [Alphaproteobacteria bacterium]
MNILFVTATRIGDAVLSTGLLRYLIERHPGAALTVAAGPLAAPLFTEVPGLARVIVVEKKARGLHWPSLWAQVATTRWDLAVDLRGSALTYLLWARQRYVMAKGNPEEHRVRQLARLFDLEPPPTPTLWLGARHLDAAAKLAPPDARLLVISPTANWPRKEWRAARFAELALRLTAPTGPLAGARVAVMAAAHERAQAAPVIAALPADRVVDFVGKLDLLTAGAILRNAALFVGNDTGLMHLAAAAGAPTLGFFGPSNVKEYAPWGPRAAYVHTALGYWELYKPGWHLTPPDSMMDSLSVDMAEAGARALLERVKGKAA